jgi:hypothetical protein
VEKGVEVEDVENEEVVGDEEGQVIESVEEAELGEASNRALHSDYNGCKKIGRKGVHMRPPNTFPLGRWGGDPYIMLNQSRLYQKTEKCILWAWTGVGFLALESVTLSMQRNRAAEGPWLAN